MFFWNSSESFRPATDNLMRVAKAVEPYLNTEFENSSLKDLNIKLRYIPIVMPVHMREKYTERSKARIKQAIYDCAPQLDYPTFVDGPLEAQCIEYLRGIALSSPHLKKFGATAQQIEDFDTIVAGAPQRIYEEIKAAESKK